MVITATKKDDEDNVTTQTVTGYSIIYEGDEETSIQAGDTYVAIAYENAILTYQISAYSTKVIRGIEVKTQPTKTTYRINEEFNRRRDGNRSKIQ